MKLSVSLPEDDVAFVDVDLTLNNVVGPDGQLHSAVHIAVAFTAVNRDRTWLVQDERAHFRTPATGGSHDGGR